MLVGDVTHDGVLYEKLSLKAKKYEYRKNGRCNVCFSKLTNEGSLTMFDVYFSFFCARLNPYAIIMRCSFHI